MNEARPVKSLDFKDIIAVVLKRKWLIIIPVFLVTILAYAGTYLLQPKYQSYTVVWIDQPSNVSRELVNIIGDRRESREDRQSRTLALQTEITSQGFLVQLIRELNLDEDPEITREAAKARESTPTFSLEQVKYNLLIERLREEITVSFHGFDQIRITVESYSAAQARDIASKLTEILEKEKTNYEMEKILDNQTFTDLQLEKTEFYYKQAIDSLNAAQTRLSKLQLPENIASEANRLDILSSIDRAKLEQEDYGRELSSVESQLSEFNLANSRLRYTDTIVELRTTIDGLISTFSSMMEKYAWNDQNVINVNIRLNDNNRLLESAIAAAVRAQYASYPAHQTELLIRYFVINEARDIVNSKQRRLEQTLAKIDDRINTIPKLESEIADLRNKVDETRRYRDAFRSEEATVGILSERAKERTIYKVIEPAQMPMAPFWPDKRKIVLMGFIVGLILGGGFVLLLEVLDNSFKRIEDVEDQLGLPVLATIPKIEKLNINR